jgi:hypothetical protein
MLLLYGNTEFISWVSVLLHAIAPLAALIDWTYIPSKKIRWNTARYWTAFPIAYFSYTMLRGHIHSWYPYMFLNPAIIGYTGVFTYASMIAVGMIMLTWFVLKAQRNKKLN